MKSPRTLADVTRDEAKNAVEQAEGFLASGDFPKARAWFERAHRFVPSDPSVATSLAGVLLRLGDPAATDLFQMASTTSETREILLGLAASAWQAGNVPAAREAMALLLARHVLPADHGPLVGLAERIAVSAGDAGWCGVHRRQNGQGLQWLSNGKAAATLDGRRLDTPDLPADGKSLVVSSGRRPLLGSPVDLVFLRRVEGFVDAHAGGLSGWAWHPSDADHDPWLTCTGLGSSTPLTFKADRSDIPAIRPMTRPRGFAVSALALSGQAGPFVVAGSDGRALAGSPVDPASAIRSAQAMARIAAQECPALQADGASTATGRFSAPAELRGVAAFAPFDPLRPVAVVIPVFAGLVATLDCLNSVVASSPMGTAIIVVDDATPDRALAADLDLRAQAGQITLLRNADNLGFPASANAGLRAAFALIPPHDALLLNSDTLVPQGRGTSWLARLRDVVHAQADIGTAAPLSNDASILSYPGRDSRNVLPDRRALARLDMQAVRANARVTVDIPTSVGFCMYVRRECAIETGLFRPSLFAQGYGEENDFCIRARHLGWRHVAVPGVVVAHLGSTSFGDSRSPLVARNLAVLEQLHPGYHRLVADYQATVPAQDALAPARRRLDAVRWAAGRKQAAIILVTHDSGGGVERVVRRRIAEIEAAGLRAIVLRPLADPDSDGGFMPGLCCVAEVASGNGFPNLVFHLPQEMPVLLQFLRKDRPVLLEVHHRLGHSSSVMDLPAGLAIPVELHVHDYASFCPRITLLNSANRYCGEPLDVATCDACVADASDRMQAPGEKPLGVTALRTRSAHEFATARRVVVPSGDMASRLRRHFPKLRSVIEFLENDRGFVPPPPPADIWPRRICVIGAIGMEKGFDVLLACARDAAERDLPLEFLLAGHSTDDMRLMQTGKVFVTGRYGEAEAETFIRRQAAHLAFLPSIWPETWGFTLGLAWRCGLRAVVFDIGAMGARVRDTGYGTVLPLGLSTAAINNALMAP